MKAVVVAAVLAASSSLAIARAVPTYTITALPTPVGASSTASAVSNFGAAGQVDNAGSNTPALWTSSGRLDLPLPDTFERGFGNGINNAGVVVGSVGTFRAPPQGAKWTNGVVELLPTEDKDPDETEFLFGSIASAINEGGTVVGQGTNQYGDTGVVWSPNGDVKLLMGLAPEGEYQYSWAQGVNNSNAVAGYAKDANGLNRAMLWQGDTATPLGLLWDQGESVAHDINDAGDIVGWGTTDDGFGKAFVVHNGTMTPLPRLDGTDYGEAFGINDDGVIIGQTLESGIEGRGFATLWMDGQAYNLESLVTNNLGSEWQLLGAFGLSDNGKIVGFGVHDGEIAAFLLTPNTVPEPATIGMLAFALPALATRRRHRR